MSESVANFAEELGVFGRFFLGFVFFVGFFAELVHEADNDENAEGDGKEVYDALDEDAVVDGGGGGSSKTGDGDAEV